MSLNRTPEHAANRPLALPPSPANTWADDLSHLSKSSVASERGAVCLESATRQKKFGFDRKIATVTPVQVTELYAARCPR